MIKIYGRVAIRYAAFAWLLRPFRRPLCKMDHKRAAAIFFRPAGLPLLILIMGYMGVTGCMDTDGASHSQQILIRCDRQIVTRSQFERAFGAAWIAYSDDPTAGSDVAANARLRLLKQMTEEVIAHRRAVELGIVLREDELEAAIGDIKKDYPENQFSQMLLESAIPFSLWRDRLRARLLLEKVVREDLGRSIDVTEQEVQAFYEAHAEEFEGLETESQTDLSHRMVQRIRREKVEAAYPDWMDGLQKRYGVEINWQLWDQIQGSDDLSVNHKRNASP